LRSPFVSLAYLFGFLAAAYVALRYLMPYFAPFLVAVLLAILIEPVVRLLEGGGRVPRGVAVAGALAAVAVSFSVLAFWGTSRLVHELGGLYRTLPYYYAASVDATKYMVERFGEVVASLPEPLQTAIERYEQQGYESLRMMVNSGLEAVVQMFRRLPSFAMMVLVTGLATFFLSRDRKQVARFLWGLVPEPWRDRVREAETEVWQAALGFVKAQVTLVCITAVLTSAGLAILGADYALLLGICAGVLDLVPYLGPTAVLGPWAVGCFLTGSVRLGFELVVLLGVLAVVRQVAEVKIVGERTGVHPAGVLLALYLGVELFGVWGFALGPLGAIVLKAAARSGLLPFVSRPR